MKTAEEKRKGIIVTLISCAIVFIVLIALLNIGTLKDILSSVLSVFTPIIIGFVIAYALNPILRLFEFKIYKKIKKLNVLRALSIVSTYVVALLILVALLYLLIPSIIDSIVDLVSNYDEYVSKTSEIINNIINKLMSNESARVYVKEEAIYEIIADFFSVSGSLLDSIIDYVIEYGMGLFVGIKNTVLGIFISVYVLISKEKLQAQVRKFGHAIFSDAKQRRVSKYINITHRTFSGYFVGKLIGASIVFLMMLILMLVFRMPYPLLIATIVGVTDIIPIFGPLIGSIPSFFIIFIVDPTKALIFLVLIVIVQQIEGNIIAPKILGEATGISSLSVIIAIIVMGDYFGFIGMAIGVPVFAVAITVVKEFVEARLKKKGKSIDTADYYLKDSVVDPYDQHVPIGKRIFDNIAGLVSKAKKLFTRCKDKESVENIIQDNNTDSTPTSVEKGSNTEGEN